MNTLSNHKIPANIFVLFSIISNLLHTILLFSFGFEQAILAIDVLHFSGSLVQAANQISAVSRDVVHDLMELQNQAMTCIPYYWVDKFFIFPLFFNIFKFIVLLDYGLLSVHN